MLNKTAYLNGLTKEKEIEIYMESHKTNLRHMRSINHNEPEISPIEINKNKSKYLQGRRVNEINIENQILTQKIQKIVNSSRNPKYHSSNQKYSRSLNGYVKRTSQSQVNQENLKLLLRLEDSKPTYSTKKYLEDFQHLKQVEKKMSTAEFYLTDSPTFRKRKLNTNRSFLSRRNSSFGDNSSFMGDKNQIVKETVTLNDAKMWEIKIFKDQKEVKITGQIIIGSNQKDQSMADLKLISIPNIEANLFLRKHCDNKLNHLIKHLKVDQKDGSLILIVPQSIKSPSLSKMVNPEQKGIGNIEKKLMNIELTPPLHKRAPPRQIFNTVSKKPMLEELPKFNSQKNHSEKHSEVKKSQGTVEHEVKKDILPKIESKKSIPNKQEKIAQKVAKEEKTQKVSANKSSVSSIKQSEKVNKQEAKNNEEQKYQEQKFEESMNNKSENKKQGQIEKQHQGQGEKIQEMKQRQSLAQEEEKIETSMQTPIQESMEKRIQEAKESPNGPAEDQGQKQKIEEKEPEDVKI